MVILTPKSTKVRRGCVSQKNGNCSVREVNTVILCFTEILRITPSAREDMGVDKGASHTCLLLALPPRCRLTLMGPVHGPSSLDSVLQGGVDYYGLLKYVGAFGAK